MIAGCWKGKKPLIWWLIYLDQTKPSESHWQENYYFINMFFSYQIMRKSLMSFSDESEIDWGWRLFLFWTRVCASTCDSDGQSCYKPTRNNISAGGWWLGGAYCHMLWTSEFFSGEKQLTHSVCLLVGLLPVVTVTSCDKVAGLSLLIKFKSSQWDGGRKSDSEPQKGFLL